MNNPITHRVWAEINLDNLVYNYNQIAKITTPSKILCVIKADAYGHGAVPVAKALASAGADAFAVATAEEALQLRRHGITGQVLLLDMVSPHWAPVLAAQNIGLAVGSLQTAQAYSKACNGTTLKVHIKIDTGMSRIGLNLNQGVEEAIAIAALPGLEIEGLFTHFAAADETAESNFTKSQYTKFKQVTDQLKKKGLDVPLLHCANSAGILTCPESYEGMVRPGIILFGCNPCPESPIPLRPVLSWRTRIVQVKRVAKGESISYGRSYVAPKDSLIATLGVGYADGLHRTLSGKISLLVGGQKAPQVGRICMDMCMVDVTGIPGVTEGDSATLIGQDGALCLTADSMAQTADTIPYEIFCSIGRRVPRLYLSGGKLEQDVCYINAL